MVSQTVKYALVINLEGKSKSEAINAWNLFSKIHSIKYISSRSPSPHITLQSDFEILDIDLFKKNFSDYCKSQKPLKIRSNGLGIFIRKTPVIYIRWSSNKELNMLQKSLRNYLLELEKQNIIKNLFNDFDWVPKTTLAYNDTSYTIINELISLINKYDYVRTMDVLGIYLYKYSEDIGEIQLHKYTLGNS